MKKNGFITSALLYGILALFLTLMLGSLAVLANRKMSMDTLKEAALEDVGSAIGASGYYNIWRVDSNSLKEYGGYVSNAGINGTWTTNNSSPYLIFSTDNYKNISGVYLNLAEPVAENMDVIVSYSDTEDFTDSKKRNVGTITNDSSSITFKFPKGNYKYIKLQIGTSQNLSYKISEIGLIIQKDE